MFGSEALDVVLGLVFLYLVLSFVCSGLNEATSSVFAWRADFLRKGIRNLLQEKDPGEEEEEPDPQLPPKKKKAGVQRKRRDLAGELYSHPLVTSLSRRRSFIGRARERYPSYLPKRTFALALLDLVVPDALDGSADPARIKASLEKIEDRQVRETLKLLLKDSRDDLDAFRANVELWFDEGMERVSGWYRRRVQLVLWIWAVAVAIALNADSFQIAKALWQDDTLRDAVVAQAEEVAAQPQQESPQGAAESITDVADEVGGLRELEIPIGWSLTEGATTEVPRDFSAVIAKLIGLLITAAALTFGSPFWFDLLKRVAQVRSSGPAPGERREKETPSP
jgi:hypothetical protein